MKGMPRTQDRIVRLGWSLMADGMMIRWMIMDQSFLFETCTSRAADEWISNSATTGWLVGYRITLSAM